MNDDDGTFVCSNCGDVVYDEEGDGDECDECIALETSGAHDTPQEEDGFISNTGPLGALTSASVSCKHLGTFREEAAAVAAIKAKMDEEGFWPNVWRIDDHGGHTLLDLSEWEVPNDAA